MEFRVRRLVFGIVNALVTYISYGVIPSVILGQLLKVFPFYRVEQGLVTMIGVVSVVLAVFAFFRSLFPGKTVAHAVAGFGSVFFSTFYLWLWAGGYAGRLGYFPLNFGPLSIEIDARLLINFMLLTTLLNSFLFVLDLTEILRKEVPGEQLPPYLLINSQEE
jgi:hypothetical protein